ncbi:MAG: carbon starvation protein A [Thermoproteota archaeon]|nr:MAG: carbon starvation protein A [Candidatus Korarchaeota archaeon]
MYPIWFVILGVIVYGLAYFTYAKWYDKHVWEPDPKKPTPAHTYMDGITFFPVSKYVLYGFQFKGIAGLGPILGPFIALMYGWVPALIWILLGNFFIGWIHDYSSLMLSVRNEGKTMGPLSYELISPRARRALLGFLVFYLILILAVFMVLCSLFFKVYPASVLAMIFLVLGGVVSGALLYKAKMGVGTSTLVGIIIIIIGIILGVQVPIKHPSLALWMVFTSIILFIAAVTPLMWVTQPVVYVASFPAIFGILLLFIGALASPATGVRIEQPGYLGFMAKAGPMWPLLTVSIACGAISGWHSLISTSGSASQLDVETDALPVGGGAMLTEGLLALMSLAAYMVLTPGEIKELGGVKWTCLVHGAKKLIVPITGGEPYIEAFYGLWLELYALTIAMIVIRFLWLTFGEITAGVPPLRVIIGNKWGGSIIGLLVAGAFAYTGAWINLWLLFGGSNQLLAGLALILVTIYLAKVKKPTIYTLAPAAFMIVTCEAALLWEAKDFFLKMGQLVKPPMKAGTLAAKALNFIFGVVGIVLFILGLLVAIDAIKAYRKAKAGG